MMPAHFAFLNTPLAREISLILVVKVLLLWGIHLLWFGQAAGAAHDTDTVGRHLFGVPSVSLENPSK